MTRRCYKCNSKGRPITYIEPTVPQYHLNVVQVNDDSKRGYSCKLVCDDCLEDLPNAKLSV